MEKNVHWHMETVAMAILITALKMPKKNSGNVTFYWIENVKNMTTKKNSLKQCSSSPRIVHFVVLAIILRRRIDYCCNKVSHWLMSFIGWNDQINNIQLIIFIILLKLDHSANFDMAFITHSRWNFRALKNL
jgi:hypothetical protein